MASPQSYEAWVCSRENCYGMRKTRRSLWFSRQRREEKVKYLGFLAAGIYFCRKETRRLSTKKREFELKFAEISAADQACAKLFSPV